MAVLFVASWCPFCRQFRPAFESEAKRSGVSWASADISDDDNVLWDTFDIEIVPTIVLFKDGKPVFRRDGVRGQGLSLGAIRETIDNVKLVGRGT